MGVGRASRRGFTLIELVVVVAIVGLLVSIALLTINRNQRRVGLAEASLELSGRLMQAQSLAAVAGSRLGVIPDAPPGDQRIEYDASCGAPPTPQLDGQLFIRFNGTTTAVIPALIQYNEGTDKLNVVCETYDITALTNNGQLNVTPANASFAFAPNGRLIGQNNPVYVEVADTGTDPMTHGLRILESGVICKASQAATPPFCNEDTGA